MIEFNGDNINNEFIFRKANPVDFMSLKDINPNKTLTVSDEKEFNDNIGDYRIIEKDNELCGIINISIDYNNNKVRSATLTVDIKREYWDNDDLLDMVSNDIKDELSIRSIGFIEFNVIDGDIFNTKLDKLMGFSRFKTVSFKVTTQLVKLNNKGLDTVSVKDMIEDLFSEEF